MKVEYAYDQDPRYGWASITVERVVDNLIVVHGEGGSYGFKFFEGQMIPACICHAYHPSECACPNVSWGDYEDD